MQTRTVKWLFYNMLNEMEEGINKAAGDRIFEGKLDQ